MTTTLTRYRLTTRHGAELSVRPRVQVGQHVTPEVLLGVRPAVDGQISETLTPGEARELAHYLCAVADEVERV